MGCSDVSEFEHIYGQIFTTPSCLYERLFTWTRMVDFNALIVWKTLIDICFSIKSSLGHWQLPIRNSEEWFGRWYEAVATGHVPRCVQYCYLIETPGDFTVEKLKTYNFVISGWIKPLQVLDRLFRQQFWWHWCLFDEEIMTLFCANNMTSNIQHGVTSHYPNVPGEPQPKALPSGDGN